MRKRIIATAQQQADTANESWLDLESLAQAEITSEDPAHPIEAALLPNRGPGWCAAGSGPQTIRLVLTRPQRLRRIWLEFHEFSRERTQEFVLRWSEGGQNSFREIIRQRWNFSPQGATSETEDFQVDLPNASVIELTIIPDISGGSSRASLASWRLA